MFKSKRNALGEFQISYNSKPQEYILIFNCTDIAKLFVEEDSLAKTHALNIEKNQINILLIKKAIDKIEGRIIFDKDEYNPHQLKISIPVMYEKASPDGDPSAAGATGSRRETPMPAARRGGCAPPPPADARRPPPPPPACGSRGRGARRTSG